MPVTLDDCALDAHGLGLETIGHVLSHVQKQHRLVVRVRIDGREPELKRIRVIRRFPLPDHAVQIDTLDPRQMASQVLAEVEQELTEVHRLTNESSSLLRRNQVASAVEKLGGLFTTWRHVQESLVKTAQILRLDPEAIKVRGRALTEMLRDFAAQLNQIRRALDGRDFNALGDLLAHKLTLAADQWRDAIGSLRIAMVG